MEYWWHHKRVVGTPLEAGVQAFRPLDHARVTSCSWVLRTCHLDYRQVFERRVASRMRADRGGGSRGTQTKEAGSDGSSAKKPRHEALFSVFIMTLLPVRFAGRAALGLLQAQAQLETHREQEKPLDGHGAFGLQPFELRGQRAERHPTNADVLGLL